MTMTHGPIGKHPNSRIDSRKDNLLPTAWVGDGTPAAALIEGEWLCGTSNLALAANTGIALVMLGKDSRNAWQWLKSQVAAGFRSYVLVGPGNIGIEDDEDLKNAPNVLFRRVPEVPASAIITKGEGFAWIGGGLSVRLDLVQSEAFRHVFLRLFWHDATDECWPDSGQLIWRKALERPFDVPALPPNSAIRLESSGTHIASKSSCEVLHIQSGKPPEAAPRRLWFRAGPDHHESLLKLLRAGAEIVWGETDLPDISIGDGEGEVLLPGKVSRLRIILNKEQRAEMSDILNTKPSWRFHADLRIGSYDLASSKFWLSGQAAPAELIERQRIEVPDVIASTLRETLATSPSAFPPPNPLALSVEYQWAAIPPRVPTGFVDDPLNDAWKNTDEAWSARIAQAKDILITADTNKGRIRNRFARLVGAMLGFDLTQSKLMEIISEIEPLVPSKAGPMEAKKLFGRLKEVEDGVKKLQGDLDGAEQKAEEDEDRERQEALWKNKKDSAFAEIPIKQAELKSLKAKKISLEDQRDQNAESLQGADEGSKKDFAAKAKMISDELHRAETNIARLQGELESFIKTSESPFVYVKPAVGTRNSTKSTVRFSPPPIAAAAERIPEEAMPSVGKLGLFKKQRYIIIDHWSWLDEGESEASRLSAKLVAPEAP